MRALAVVFLAFITLGQTGYAAEKWVLTPGGYRSQSLVHRIAQGKVIQHVSGSFHVIDPVDQSVTVLSSLPQAMFSPLASGWISYTMWDTKGDTVKSFRTTWVVPSAPSKQSEQTLFFFNGMEPASFSTILQPVLQWGGSSAGGGKYWSIASWYVSSSGQALHTDLIAVKPGDTLEGVMKLTGRNGKSFDYTSEFEGIANTTLTIKNIDELAFPAESMEAYSIQDCAEYNSQEIDFKNIVVQSEKGVTSIPWKASNRITDCGQHVKVMSESATDGEVSIFTH